MTAARIPERLERGRLIYERVSAEHAADYDRLLRHPQVVPTLWRPDFPPSPADAMQSLLRGIARWEQDGFGLWVLRDRASGAVVGRGGLERLVEAGRDEVEIAWVIDPGRWGEGLATELALTSAETAFGPLGLDSLIAVTLPGNAASRRVMEKTGFVYEADTVHAGLDHVLYRLTATDFAQTPRSSAR